MTVYLDQSGDSGTLDPTEFQAAYQAVLAFDQLPLGLKLVATTDPTASAQITFEDGHSFLPSDYAGETSYYPQDTNPNAFKHCDIYFNGFTEESLGLNLLNTAEHELGHSVGLAHSPDPFDLMYYAYNGTTSYSSADVTALLSLYGN